MTLRRPRLLGLVYFVNACGAVAEAPMVISGPAAPHARGGV
ncbi:hypothetical protein OG563_09540 [Nocardia vinacea]|uniref:Uncharacterized protein n=1 Tax=Nocardia vinacea TaxID=96468 RepID=A0ABZ1Z341_9NOCA|nr:hypothetical protein [Nocardia vinacea]